MWRYSNRQRLKQFWTSFWHNCQRCNREEDKCERLGSRTELRDSPIRKLPGVSASKSSVSSLSWQSGREFKTASFYVRTVVDSSKVMDVVPTMRRRWCLVDLTTVSQMPPMCGGPGPGFSHCGATHSTIKKKWEFRKGRILMKHNQLDCLFQEHGARCEEMLKTGFRLSDLPQMPSNFAMVCVSMPKLRWSLSMRSTHLWDSLRQSLHEGVD